MPLSISYLMPLLSKFGCYIAGDVLLKTLKVFDKSLAI